VGTCGGPGSAPSWEREPEPRGHVAAPELPRAGSRSPSRGDTWRPRSCPELGVGAQAAGTRGSLGAALSREQEPEPRGHVAAPELGVGAQAAETRGSLGAALNREAEAVVLT
jgi:hypothetical protein